MNRYTSARRALERRFWRSDFEPWFRARYIRRLFAIKHSQRSRRR